MYNLLKLFFAVKIIVKKLHEMGKKILSKENYIVDRIEELLELRKMSRYALSQQSGISQASISTLLNRKCIPTIPTLEKICDAFNITIAQFFSSNGSVPDLTEEQKEVLEIWTQLNEREKELVMAYIQGLMRR